MGPLLPQPSSYRKRVPHLNHEVPQEAIQTSWKRVRLLCLHNADSAAGTPVMECEFDCRSVSA